jgi:hypothetical protein
MRPTTRLWYRILSKNTVAATLHYIEWREHKEPTKNASIEVESQLEDGKGKEKCNTISVDSRDRSAKDREISILTSRCDPQQCSITFALWRCYKVVTQCRYIATAIGIVDPVYPLYLCICLVRSGIYSSSALCCSLSLSIVKESGSWHMGSHCQTPSTASADFEHGWTLWETNTSEPGVHAEGQMQPIFIITGTSQGSSSHAHGIRPRSKGTLMTQHESRVVSRFHEAQYNLAMAQYWVHSYGYMSFSDAVTLYCVTEG